MNHRPVFMEPFVPDVAKVEASVEERIKEGTLTTLMSRAIFQRCNDDDLNKYKYLSIINDDPWANMNMFLKKLVENRTVIQVVVGKQPVPLITSKRPEDSNIESFNNVKRTIHVRPEKANHVVEQVIKKFANEPLTVLVYMRCDDDDNDDYMVLHLEQNLDTQQHDLQIQSVDHVRRPLDYKVAIMANEYTWTSPQGKEIRQMESKEATEARNQKLKPLDNCNHYATVRGFGSRPTQETILQLNDDVTMFGFAFSHCLLQKEQDVVMYERSGGRSGENMFSADKDWTMEGIRYWSSEEYSEQTNTRSFYSLTLVRVMHCIKPDIIEQIQQEAKSEQHVTTTIAPCA